eukprot:3705240-Pleurochrysis_carterae.AAC.1
MSGRLALESFMLLNATADATAAPTATAGVAAKEHVERSAAFWILLEVPDCAAAGGCHGVGSPRGASTFATWSRRQGSRIAAACAGFVKE